VSPFHLLRHSSGLLATLVVVISFSVNGFITANLSPYLKSEVRPSVLHFSEIFAYIIARCADFTREVCRCCTKIAKVARKLHRVLYVEIVPPSSFALQLCRSFVFLLRCCIGFALFCLCSFPGAASRCDV